MPSTINADNGVVSGSAGLKSAADSSGVLQLQTNGTTAVTVDTSQNVGIGTSSPSYRLDVTGQARATTGFAVSTDGSTFTPSGLNAIPNYGTGYITSTSRVALSGFGGLSFYTNQALSMLVDQSGNVGIGTTAPGTRLHVDSGTSGDQIRISNGAGATVYYRIGRNTSTGYLDFYGSQTGFTGYVFGGVDGERARIDSSGNLLVGTTASEGPSRLSVVSSTSGTACIGFRNSAGAGSTLAAFINSGNNAIIGSIINNGNTAVTYNTTSDYRLKEDIQPMTGALAKVAALKPCTYKWKADGSDGQGFIAHELQEVVPDCVIGEKDAVDAEGKPIYQGIDTSFLVATLTAAIQELKAEVDSLKSQLAAKG